MEYKKNDEFFKEFADFNDIKSQEEKYEKAISLIKKIPSIDNVNEEDKIFYYGIVSSIYYFIANAKCKKYGLSNRGQFIADKILDDENRDYLNEIISDEINAFNYGKAGLEKELLSNSLKIMSREKKVDTKEIANLLMQQDDKNKEDFRKITQELTILYYILNDEEKFIFYGEYAVKYNSLNAINLFLKYYCDKMDFDNANYYYELMHTYPVADFYGSIRNNLALKIAGHKIYWDFFYNLGNYEESKKIAEACKDFVLKNRLDDEILLYVENHTKDCEQKIQELNNNTYTEEALFNYFDKDVVDLMSDENKIYILTSLNIYNYMKSKENEITMDYSATLMPILKAVENMIFYIVGVCYHKFILGKNEKEIDKNAIEPFINRKDNTINKRENPRLELGTALKLIGDEEPSFNIWEEKKIIPNKYFIEFCNKNNINNSKNVIITIYKNLDNLRNTRNRVAHKDRILEKDLEQCYSILLNDIKFINFLYNNFRFVFENYKK